MKFVLCMMVIIFASGFAGAAGAANPPTTPLLPVPAAPSAAAPPATSHETPPVTTPAAPPPTAPTPSAAEKQLYVVGTAHLDTQWRWTILETINDYIPATLRQNFELFEKYPDYVFSFEGAFRYMLMKEYYPAEYERMKRYIESGRWKVAGSWVDAVDTNIPSPESLIRHALLGNGFFRREFGVTSRDVFLPDCFGFGYALPSIAAHCGITGFSTQKLTWGSAIGVPFDIGVWEGVDGSRVFAALNPGAYVSEVKDDLSADSAVVATVNHQGAASGLYAAYKYIGTGDQGGSPTDSSVLWLERSIQKPKGEIRVRSVSSDQLARDLSAMPAEIESRLPHYRGELLMTRHGAGCYTSQSAMKRWNRKNERLADAAERASVAAAWLGGVSYPRETLDQAWVRFLWHQFHDDLTGTSIPQAYTFSWNDEAISQNQFAGVLESGAGAVARALDTRVKGIPIIVYNPLSIDREDVVDATVTFQGERPAAVNVVGPDGRETPAQAEAGSDPRALRVTFLAKVPPVGFAVYDVQPATAKRSSMRNDLSASEFGLSNSRYRIRIDESGDIASIMDLRNQRELLAAPIRLQMLDDAPRNWAAWEVDYAAVMAPPREFVSVPAQARVIEKGPARAGIEITRTSGGSTFRQRIYLAAGGAGDRVEVVNDIDWRTPATLLKVAFPLAVSSDTATYDLGLGTIERTTNSEKKYEVPAQQWADLTDAEGRHGVAILNDCKYGWDKPDDHTLRLTLIHTPGVNQRWQWIDDQSSMDLGRHHVTYAIYGHEGDWPGQVTPQADRLNQPLVAFQTTPSKAAKPAPLGRSFSFARVSNPAVALRAVKQAEESDEIIVRMEETNGFIALDVRLACASPIVAAREVNGAEEPVGASVLRDGMLVTDFQPYQPRTFAIRIAPPPAPAGSATMLSLPATQNVLLPYNLVGITPHGAVRPGDMDEETRGSKTAERLYMGDAYAHTFPGELLPATVTCQGIPFATGPRGEGQPNIVECHGQTIPLPSGNFGSLYLLASAFGGDRVAQFRVGELAFGIPIQDAEEPIAQWDNRVDGEDLITDPAAIQPAYTKGDRIAWVGTHRHRPDGKCDPYAYLYLYLYAIDLPLGARSVTLPDDPGIRIAAMTVADDPNARTRFAQAMIDPSSATLVRIESPGTHFLDSVPVALRSPIGGAQIRYTTDGSEPNANSSLYAEPLTITSNTTVRARAFRPGMDDRYVAVATFTKLEMREAVRPSGALEPGLEARYIEGTWQKVPEFEQARPRKVAVVETVQIPAFVRQENFALQLSGFIRIPSDGMYTFYLASDDGSFLDIGSDRVIDNDGPHSQTERKGAVALRAGLHALRIGYYQGVGDAALELQIEGPGILRQAIPKEMLTH